MNEKTIQKYINNYRRKLTKFLRPDFGLLCNIYPSDAGAILEFVIGIEQLNDDIYHPNSESLGKALSNVEQSAFGGNIQGFSFTGTNTILEQSRIIYIKDSSPSEWDTSAVNKDVESVLPNSPLRARQ
jgi:hypothetical protein